MATLTITLDGQLLERARKIAAEEGRTLHDVLVEHVATYADSSVEEGGGWRELWRIAKRSTGGSGPGGRTWKREDLYDD